MRSRLVVVAVALFLVGSLALAQTKSIVVEGRTVNVQSLFDLGWEHGRQWLDINLDGKGDEFCRVGGDKPDHQVLECTFFVDSTQVGNTVETVIPDWGYAAGRRWVDADGNGTIDYCRVIGNPPNVKCECIEGHRDGTFGMTFPAANSVCPVPDFLVQGKVNHDTYCSGIVVACCANDKVIHAGPCAYTCGSNHPDPACP